MHQGPMFERPRWRSSALILVFSGLLLVVAACSDSNGDDGSDADGSSDEAQDPVSFVIELLELAEDGDWEAVQDRMVDDYQEFSPEVLEDADGTLDPFPGDSMNPDNWTVEEDDSFTIVRNREYPSGVMLLRSDDGGQWRYDPLPMTHLRARMEADNLQPAAQNPPPWQPTVESDSDAEPLALLQVLRPRIELLRVDDTVDLTLHIFLAGWEHAEIPLDGLYWNVDGEQHEAEITWRSAILDGDVLRTPERRPGNDATSTFFTFRLDHVPDAEEIELVMEDVLITGSEDDPDETIELDFRYAGPVMELPELEEWEER